MPSAMRSFDAERDESPIDDEVRETKRFYGWPEEAQFLAPDGGIFSASGPAKRWTSLSDFSRTTLVMRAFRSRPLRKAESYVA